MQNRHAEAIIEFQEALNYDSSKSIYYAIAKSYKELGKFNQSIANALKSLETDSTFIQSYELLVDDYLAQFKIDDAISAYEQIYKLDQSKYRKFELARLYEFKNVQKAINLYKEILEEGEDVTVLDRLAVLYGKSGERDKYIETLEKIYSLSSEDSYMASILLKGYLANKTYKKALDFLHESAKTLSSSELSDNYLIMADSLLVDNSNIAKEFIPDYIKDPGNRSISNWKNNLMNAYLEINIKDTLNAEKIFLQTLKSDDSISEVPFSVGIFYFSWKKYNNAMKIFRENEDKFPKEARFPFYIGVTYSIQDSDFSAIPPLKRALAIDSSNLDIFGELGMVYDKLKLYDSCEFYYEKALLIKKDDPLINNNYAYALSVRGIKLDRALEMVSIAINADSLNASFLDTFGWVQFKMGNYPLALDYVLRSINHGASSGEVYEHLGEIYYKMDNIQDARKAWQTALGREPNNKILLDKLNSIK
jgi:tetratricopeptide (TPR) repeat protein